MTDEEVRRELSRLYIEGDRLLREAMNKGATEMTEPKKSEFGVMTEREFIKCAVLGVVIGTAISAGIVWLLIFAF